MIEREIQLRTTLLAIIAICITILESVAIMNGINGTQFTIVIIALGGIGGFSLEGVVQYVRKQR